MFSSYICIHTVASKNIHTLTIFIEILFCPLIKIYISKWLFNNKICNLFLTNLYKIFLKHTKNLLLRYQKSKSYKIFISQKSLYTEIVLNKIKFIVNRFLSISKKVEKRLFIRFVCPSIYPCSNSCKYSSNVLKLLYVIHIWCRMNCIENGIHMTNGLSTETDKSFTIHYSLWGENV